MKKEIYSSLFAVVWSIGMAFSQQAQNPQCMTNLSIYAEHVKVKNYDAAYEPWKMVLTECPGINKANFSYGERILKHKIKNSSGAEKDGYIQDLLALYDQSGKYYPQNYGPASITIDKVLLRYDNDMISDDEIYAQCSEAFNADLKNFKNPKALYLYFSSLVNLHKAGKKDLQEVFNVYDDVIAKVEDENKKLLTVLESLLPKEDAGTLTSKEKRQLRVARTNSESYGKITGSIDAKLGDLADCDNLIPLYKKNFPAHTADLVWIKRAMSKMFAKECTDDPLFRELLDARLAIDPSAEIYFYKGILEQKAGNNTAAIAAFNKSVDLEDDRDRKAEVLYKIATMMKRRGQKSSSRSYANKALAQNASLGKAYLLIANLYASSANDCGSTTFEKKAVYWKAAEMARKAARVDPSLRSQAAKSAESYEARAPSRTEIFNSAMEGQTITFSCWMGGSVTVPKL